MLCFHAAQTGKHLLRTQNVSEQNQKHFLCPQQMLHQGGNGVTFVPATMCPQQCVFVCQGLKIYAIYALDSKKENSCLPSATVNCVPSSCAIFPMPLLTAVSYGVV